MDECGKRQYVQMQMKNCFQNIACERGRERDRERTSEKERKRSSNRLDSAGSAIGANFAAGPTHGYITNNLGP